MRIHLIWAAFFAVFTAVDFVTYAHNHSSVTLFFAALAVFGVGLNLGWATAD